MNKFNISIAKKVESSPNLFLNNLFYRIFSLEKFFLKKKQIFQLYKHYWNFKKIVIFLLFININ